MNKVRLLTRSIAEMLAIIHTSLSEGENENRRQTGEKLNGPNLVWGKESDALKGREEAN